MNLGCVLKKKGLQLSLKGGRQWKGGRVFEELTSKHGWCDGPSFQENIGYTGVYI